ncbi:MAG TPA: hypothetical protein PKV76_08225, partial [Chitinophagales bacterium]|nr:hypothetical protein [Chitinophagales bacterium]
MYNQFNKTLFISAIVFLLSASLFVACKSADEKAADETEETTTEPTDITTEVTTTTTETTPSEWLPFKESATIINAGYDFGLSFDETVTHLFEVWGIDSVRTVIPNINFFTLEDAATYMNSVDTLADWYVDGTLFDHKT